MEGNKELNSLETTVKLIEHSRRLSDLEQDIKAIKPIVYETANSVKQIEKLVGKMEANSDKMRGYILAAVTTGIIGIVFIALKQTLGIGG